MSNENLNNNSKNTANKGKTNIKITSSDDADNVRNYVIGETRSSSSHKFHNNTENTSNEN